MRGGRDKNFIPSLSRDLNLSLERLVNVLEDVLDGLEADREAHHVRGAPRRVELCRGELGVRGRRRVDGEGARVADVGHVRDELQAVDESGTRLLAVVGLDAEDDNPAALALDVVAQAHVRQQGSSLKHCMHSRFQGLKAGRFQAWVKLAPPHLDVLDLLLVLRVVLEPRVPHPRHLGVGVHKLRHQVSS